MKYLVISPVKNESAFIGKTICSMISQSLLPIEWIIVDDGSSDETAGIVLNYAKQIKWIKYVHRKSENEIRNIGSKVVNVFNYGLKYISQPNYDFIVKLDGDLILPPTYFEAVAKEFQNDSKLGLCGGYCINLIDGTEFVEKSAPYHIRGAFKSIRKECWDNIEGFRDTLGWDGLDEMNAMFKGWKTKVIDKAVIHLRPTGNAYNKKDLAYKQGYANYKNGGNLFLMIVRTLSRIPKKLFLISSFFYFKGYISAFYSHEGKNVSPELAKFINHFHTQRLWKGIFKKKSKKV